MARSGISALVTLGTGEVRVAGPRTLMPDDVESLGVKAFPDINKALAGADVIMGLRLQNERMQGATIPSSGEFYRTYGLTPERLKLAKPDAIVMHPGADQSRRGDRRQRGRRQTIGDPATGHLRHCRAHGSHVDHHGSW